MQFAKRSREGVFVLQKLCEHMNHPVPPNPFSAKSMPKVAPVCHWALQFLELYLCSQCLCGDDAAQRLVMSVLRLGIEPRLVSFGASCYAYPCPHNTSRKNPRTNQALTACMDDPSYLTCETMRRRLCETEEMGGDVQALCLNDFVPWILPRCPDSPKTRSQYGNFFPSLSIPLDVLADVDTNTRQPPTCGVGGLSPRVRAQMLRFFIRKNKVGSPMQLAMHSPMRSPVVHTTLYTDKFYKTAGDVATPSVRGSPQMPSPCSSLPTRDLGASPEPEMSSPVPLTAQQQGEAICPPPRCARVLAAALAPAPLSLPLHPVIQVSRGMGGDFVVDAEGEGLDGFLLA